jgi:hypothetical protein
VSWSMASEMRQGFRAPTFLKTEEDRLWLEAIYGGLMQFDIADDSGTTIRCKLCRQEWHRSEVYGLYAQDRDGSPLHDHVANHLEQVPKAKRDSIFALIQLGSEWSPACKEILGVSPLEREEWIRFWRLPEP